MINLYTADQKTVEKNKQKVKRSVREGYSTNFWDWYRHFRYMRFEERLENAWRCRFIIHTHSWRRRHPEEDC